MSRLRVLPAACALALVALTGCSSTTSSVGRTTPDTGSVPDTGGSLPETSAPPATDASTTTTTPVDPLLLLRDGIGTHRFGDDAATVLTDLQGLLGAPTSDTAASYPVATGDGSYQDADGENQFVAPTSRTVCWDNGLCAVFGGGTADAQSFTGWSYSGDLAGSLHSESEATIGSTWAELPTMTVGEGGCYSVGSGTIDGITLVLQSNGTPFMEVDGSGNMVTHTPAAADVVILSMEAGDVPLGLIGDC